MIRTTSAARIRLLAIVVVVMIGSPAAVASAKSGPPCTPATLAGVVVASEFPGWSAAWPPRCHRRHRAAGSDVIRIITSIDVREFVAQHPTGDPGRSPQDWITQAQQLLGRGLGCERDQC
jgi:hypothetical protein